MGRRRGMRPVIRRIVVTSVSGAGSYPLTNMLFDAEPQQLAMSAAVGAVALVVQLLVEVEQRLSAVETSQVDNATKVNKLVADGFEKVSGATEAFSKIGASGLSTRRFTDLAGKAGDIGPEAPPLIVAFAQAEIDRVTKLFAALAGSELKRDGEEHEDLLTLTGIVKRSIDATSLFAVDGMRVGSEGGFWSTDHGHRYLRLQRRAVERGVRVRRIFVVRDEQLLVKPEFEKMCQTQADFGIDVRVLLPSQLGTRPMPRDYVLFDDTISYETTPYVELNDSEPRIQSTSMNCADQQVHDLIEDYAQLWDAATSPWAPRLTGQATSATDPRLDPGSPIVVPSQENRSSRTA